MAKQFALKGEEFEIRNISPDMYEETEELFMHVFPNYENMCLATNMKESPEALEELRQLLHAVLPDGISFAVIHKPTGKIVAICCNKIINHKKNISLDEVFESFKTPQMFTIDAYLVRLENDFDVFKQWQVESAFEIEFLAVHPDWTKRGLAFNVCSYALDFAVAMSKGELTPEQMAQMPDHIRKERPDVSMGVFTSLYTQRMAAKLNFIPVNVVPMTEFSFEGKTFAEVVAPEHVNSQHAAKKL
ncbi:uncharacterized protein LOC115624148 [Scaptodrosophila lebanonensis]|uniref:Uncharacterized protein LOC115624148 n=1 Tax=Drosophila lebanonensis TaxID=7225 RepID=A0A6J2TF33_DROLE|nr:uncharacterized protein LOC115624148 [Scaptodrosophila lebanonensis]